MKGETLFETVHLKLLSVFISIIKNNLFFVVTRALVGNEIFV